jgi:plastocyanin
VDADINHQIMTALSIHQKHTARTLILLFPRSVRSNLGIVASAALLIYVAAMNCRAGQPKDTGSQAAHPVPVEVLIENHAFSPKSITIPVGGKITWINRDSAAHTITAVGIEPKKSPVLKQGQSVSDTFSNPGTFPYFCSIHPDMTGTVIVK